MGRLFLFQFVGVVHRARFIGAALGNRFGTLHHKTPAHFTRASGWTRSDSIFAIGVSGARIEDAEATLALHHLSFFAYGTLDSGFHFLKLVGVLLYKFAFRVIGAGDEAAKIEDSYVLKNFFHYISSNHLTSKS